MSDQAHAFCGNVIAQMCDYLRVDKIRMSPYHPQSNGQVERVHQTLLQMIGKLEEDKCKDWPMHLGSVVHAYNTTRSFVTGFSPHYLMSKAKETAFQEARHHKRIYNKKAGAIELQPGDCVLVKMDAFQGQRRKLKNWWSDDLWRVVRQIADDMPTYVVHSMRTGETKVLH